jgi:precorrin-6A/cobalt-precorrin-6A reductase
MVNLRAGRPRRAGIRFAMANLHALREPLTVLVLGGTGEGYDLAAALADQPGIRTISSLAGRTSAPRLPPGEVRIGGFGGAEGLAAYLVARAIGAVIDATHPFAATIGRNAAAACAAAGVPLLRLERPAWRPAAGDDWIEVEEWDAAVAFIASQARRVLLAVGRRELSPFAGIDAVWFLVRSVDMPDPMPPFRQLEILLARGPFTVAGERDLLRAKRIDTIVCKNSGGDATAAKLAAARELGIRVVMKRRPPRPDLPAVASVAAALAWLRSLTER